MTTDNDRNERQRGEDSAAELERELAAFVPRAPCAATTSIAEGAIAERTVDGTMDKRNSAGKKASTGSSLAPKPLARGVSIAAALTAAVLLAAAAVWFMRDSGDGGGNTAGPNSNNANNPAENHAAAGSGGAAQVDAAQEQLPTWWALTTAARHSPDEWMNELDAPRQPPASSANDHSTNSNNGQSSGGADFAARPLTLWELQQDVFQELQEL